MAAKVDLYNSAYGSYEADVYRRIRTATYGQDFGQTSWVTTEESHKIPRLLDLSPRSSVLEIGSGSGRYALHLVETMGCRLLGVGRQRIRRGECEPFVGRGRIFGSRTVSNL